MGIDLDLREVFDDIVDIDIATAVGSLMPGVTKKRHVEG